MGNDALQNQPTEDSPFSIVASWYFVYAQKHKIMNRARKEEQPQFLYWWLFAILTRIIAAKTNAHWFHPDEWCQTFEPASLIAHGFGFHSQEIGLHLRNLTWASLLAGVMKFTHALAPFSVSLRVFAVNLLCGLLDLGIVWGWIRMMQKDEVVSRAPLRARQWGLALLLLPWFAVFESVSPRAEHLSEIAIWVSLGCVATEAWVAAGIASVAIIGFRYPSALITLGVAISVVLHAWKAGSPRSILRFMGGMLIGLGVFGFADAWFYGRPWESFWMYLQYNVFTGSSTENFGRQSFLEYREYFLWNWATYRFMIPVGISLGFCSIYGLFQGVRKLQPWSLCLLIYLIGHLVVPHKEGRFMLPVEALFRWSAFVGACSVLPYFKNWVRSCAGPWDLTSLLRPAKVLVIIFLIAHELIFLHHLRADFLKDRGVYLEVGSWIKRDPSVCAVMTPIEVTSLLIPFQKPSQAPEPAAGKYHLEEGQDISAPVYPGSFLYWVQHPPQCSDTETVLFQVHAASEKLERNGCELLPSGIFAFLPQKLRTRVLRSKATQSAWYRCSPQIINRFQNREVHESFSSGFGTVSALPHLGITAAELRAIGFAASVPPKNPIFPSAPGTD